MKVLLRSFLVTASLLLTVGAPDISAQLDASSDPARKVIEDQIINAADQGFLSVALQAANAEIAKSPDWHRLLLIRSQIHKALKQPGQVIADYSTLIGKIPATEANFSDLARLYGWRADEHLAAGSHDQALLDFAKAITYGDQRFANAFTNHARKHIDPKDLSAFLYDHAKVLTNLPANKAAPIYFNRARTNADYGNIDAAIADYTRMMELTPGEITAVFNLGRLYAKKGDYASAAKVYTAAIQNYKGKDPRGVYEWYNFRASAHAAARNVDAALADYSKSIEINPGQQKGYLARAELYCARGAVAQAKEDEATAVRLGASVTAPCTATAQKTIQKPHVVEKSVVPAEKTPAVPATAAGWFAKGNQLLDDRDLEAAVAAFTQAIKLRAGYAEAYGRRAGARFAAMEQTAAHADINKAIALDPTNPEFYITRASFYCFTWEAVETKKDLDLAKKDEAKAVQLGGKVDRPCGTPSGNEE